MGDRTLMTARIEALEEELEAERDHIANEAAVWAQKVDRAYAEGKNAGVSEAFDEAYVAALEWVLSLKLDNNLVLEQAAQERIRARLRELRGDGK